MNSLEFMYYLQSSKIISSYQEYVLQLYQQTYKKHESQKENLSPLIINNFDNHIKYLP